MSSITDWTDRNTCVLFGDGAGAVVVGESEGTSHVESIHLHANGEHAELIEVPGGGSRYPASEDTMKQKLQFVKMKGNETFKVAVKTMEEAVREVLAFNQRTIADVNVFVPHQANIRILKAVAQRLKFPIEKTVVNLDRFGNTSAASIPLALDEAVRTGKIHTGSLVLLAAFGAGLTWASALIRW